jgi:hypothetical protein
MNRCAICFDKSSSIPVQQGYSHESGMRQWQLAMVKKTIVYCIVIWDGSVVILRSVDPLRRDIKINTVVSRLWNQVLVLLERLRWFESNKVQPMV